MEGVCGFCCSFHVYSLKVKKYHLEMTHYILSLQSWHILSLQSWQSSCFHHLCSIATVLELYIFKNNNKNSFVFILYEKWQQLRQLSATREEAAAVSCFSVTGRATSTCAYYTACLTETIIFSFGVYPDPLPYQD